MLGLTIPILIGRIIGALLGLTIHEWAHAWMAVRLGDNTPRYQVVAPYSILGGRLTLGGRDRLSLDPRAHIDPVGFLLAVLVGFGWAYPVPINPRVFYPNERRGIMLVALAGPISNLVQVFFFGAWLRLLLEIGVFSAYSFLFDIMATIVFFNIVLFLFNLIPLFPLDGWRIMLGLLPIEQSIQLQRYERESMFILIMILMVGVLNPAYSLIWLIIGPIARELFDLATGFPFF